MALCDSMEPRYWAIAPRLAQRRAAEEIHLPGDSGLQTELIVLDGGRICVLIVLLVQIASGIEGRELVGADYPVETLELADPGGCRKHVPVIFQSLLYEVLEQRVGE